MGLNLKDIVENQQVISKLDRLTRAVERLADIVELALPSPLTSPNFKDNDLKPKGEDTLKIYGDREAYWDEVKQMQKEMQDDARDELS